MLPELVGPPLLFAATRINSVRKSRKGAQYLVQFRGEGRSQDYYEGKAFQLPENIHSNTIYCPYLQLAVHMLELLPKRSLKDKIPGTAVQIVQDSTCIAVVDLDNGECWSRTNE